jgi:hypothetical protein
MYKIANTTSEQFIINQDNGVWIPLALGNTDYDNFKYQINHDEAQLETPEGVVMTSAEAKAYMATLP